jgi:hypothetical protein
LVSATMDRLLDSPFAPPSVYSMSNSHSMYSIIGPAFSSVDHWFGGPAGFSLEHIDDCTHRFSLFHTLGAECCFSDRNEPLLLLDVVA